MHMYCTCKFINALGCGATGRALSDEHDTRSIVVWIGSHSTGYRITCVNVCRICIALLDEDVLTAYLCRGFIDTQYAFDPAI